MQTAREIIAGEIKSRGVIPFARFMEVALYCPLCGFYEAEGDKIGKQGDFYTSPSVGSLFGELLASRFAQWIGTANQTLSPGVPARPMPNVQLIEAGAHKGALARDILRWFRNHRSDLLDRLDYVIIEPSARRRDWQRAMLAEFSGKILWVGAPAGLAGLPATRRIAFSNELLDAMPVHRYSWEASTRRWIEWGVDFSNGDFTWAKMDYARETELPWVQPRRKGSANAEGFASQLLGALSIAARGGCHVVRPGKSWPEFQPLFEALPNGFILEVSPAAEDWWREMARLIPDGRLLAFDYGYTADFFLAPERGNGTLRAFKGHHSSLKLLDSPGEQDLTAHVNFSAIRRAGEAEGMRTEAFLSQEGFLTSIARPMWETGSKWDASQNTAFRTLTHPDHLGRAFRALIQGRGRPGAD